jgi:hypothetical protein
MFDHDSFDKRFESNWNRIEKTHDAIFKYTGVLMVITVVFSILAVIAAAIGVYWMFVNVL